MVVEEGGFEVVDAYIKDGEVAAVGFEGFVGEARVVEHFNASELHPDDVVAVMGEFHGVGFGVADADGCFGCNHV